MKYVTLLIAICITTICLGQNNKTILNLKNANKSEVLLGEELLKNVDFIQDFSSFQNSKGTAKPMLIQFKNHHPTKKLLPHYVINGEKYSDDGNGNDASAGDGIFTSTNKFLPKNLPNNITKVHNYSTSYTGPTSRIVKFGCKVRLVPCPENNWWDSCWPLSSPCQCVEFYDCEFEIEL